MTEDSEGAEAVELANKLQAACTGHSTVAVYCAVGMVLGWGVAQGKTPDVDGLLALIRKVMVEEMERHPTTPPGG